MRISGPLIAFGLLGACVTNGNFANGGTLSWNPPPAPAQLWPALRPRADDSATGYTELPVDTGDSEGQRRAQEARLYGEIGLICSYGFAEAASM
jgi:hypothetical protein